MVILKMENKNVHHDRRSIRLKGYDYSRPGAYFITICTSNRECWFGEIIDDKMILNEYGKIAKQCWIDIPVHFPDVMLDEFIVMPNHIHGIVVINRTNKPNPVGANNHSPSNSHSPVNVGAKNFSPLQSLKSPSRSIGSIVRGFKIGVTKRLRDKTPEKFPPHHSIWQRNYYEHIIRNEQSYIRISEYICDNPQKWANDKFFP